MHCSENHFGLSAREICNGAYAKNDIDDIDIDDVDNGVEDKTG